MIWRIGLVVAVLVVVGCGGVADWDAVDDIVADVDIDTEADADDDPEADAVRYMCRGVMGLRCPAGLVCVDVQDGCYPDRGHMDCIGECIEP